MFIVQEGAGFREINTGDPAHGQKYHGLLQPLNALWAAYDRQWKVADVTLDFTGKYTIKYGYEHRRLADDFDVEATKILNNYVERFRHELPRR
jgi:hypothetical protein